jgi:hypothetical protein
MSRFPDTVDGILRDAGWTPGRDIGQVAEDWINETATSGSFEVNDEVRRIVHEFGGLKVDQRGPGINVARESFHIDPRGAYLPQLFDEYSLVLGHRLFPIGEGGHGHFFIAVSDDRRVFAIGPWLTLIGANIDEAIRNLIEGRNGSMIDRDA